MNKTLAPYLLLLLLIALLFVLNLFVGSVGIPPGDVLSILLGSFSGSEAWRFIILETRLPQALTALLCGGALSVSDVVGCRQYFAIQYRRISCYSTCRFCGSHARYPTYLLFLNDSA